MFCESPPPRVRARLPFFLRPLRETFLAVFDSPILHPRARVAPVPPPPEPLHRPRQSPCVALAEPAARPSPVSPPLHPSSGKEVKVEDFVELVLNFGDGGEESDRGQEPAAPKVTTEYKSKNLEAERRWRGRLNNNILALRAVVPKIDHQDE